MSVRIDCHECPQYCPGFFQQLFIRASMASGSTPSTRLDWNQLKANRRLSSVDAVRLLLGDFEKDALAINELRQQRA